MTEPKALRGAAIERPARRGDGRRVAAAIRGTLFPSNQKKFQIDIDKLFLLIYFVVYKCSNF